MHLVRGSCVCILPYVDTAIAVTGALLGGLCPTDMMAGWSYRGVVHVLVAALPA